MNMIGHNNGPTMEPGAGWRKHAWTRARADLLPTLPIEIVRQRVRRAREIGLDYRTYATVRATTGRDIVAFLFSSNALALRRAAADLPDTHVAKLSEMQHCDRMLAAHRPLDPAAIMAGLGARGVPFAHGFDAPLFTHSWAQVRDRMRQELRGCNLNPATVLMVGDTALERDWADAGRMAGYLPAGRYFDAAPADRA